MTKLFARSHLRLVSSVDSTAKEEAWAPLNSLHSEEFLNATSSITAYFMSESSLLRRDGFISFLRDSDVRCLFDVRAAPRLDFMAPTRAIAFKRFVELGVHYVDVIGSISASVSWTESSQFMPESWAGLVSEQINLLPPQKSVAFIFDNDDVLRRSQNVLPTALQLKCKSIMRPVPVPDDCELIAL